MQCAGLRLIVTETMCRVLYAEQPLLKTIYKLLDWNFECKYRIRGIRKQKEDESILIFQFTGNGAVVLINA